MDPNLSSLSTSPISDRSSRTTSRAPDGVLCMHDDESAGFNGSPDDIALSIWEEPRMFSGLSVTELASFGVAGGALFLAGPSMFSALLCTPGNLPSWAPFYGSRSLRKPPVTESTLAYSLLHWPRLRATRGCVSNRAISVLNFLFLPSLSPGIRKASAPVRLHLFDRLSDCSIRASSHERVAVVCNLSERRLLVASLKTWRLQARLSACRSWRQRWWLRSRWIGARLADTFDVNSASDAWNVDGPGLGLGMLRRMAEERTPGGWPVSKRGAGKDVDAGDENTSGEAGARICGEEKADEDAGSIFFGVAVVWQTGEGLLSSARTLASTENDTVSSIASSFEPVVGAEMESGSRPHT
ncbi:hypothetical protein B0H11DRAFT_1922368 [Mycena galericulata]|nr:hypothetical protein B0H11DRAFT_1922368 [Mycena galericulata]